MATSSKPPRLIVLVVEDEPLSRLYAASIAQEAGFETIEAGNAAEAIVLLESRDDIRIVVTDIDMPGSMNGLHLSRAIRDRWPPVELILMSGHTYLRSEDLPARGRFFPKPIDADRLTEALREFGAS